MLAALGFERTLPFVQGSQGCTAYFRSHLSRHFKEPIATVSSSMTEDAAVFGGLSNMIEGLENANAMYKPDMIAVSTTCMAEVIGDDLSAYIKTAKDKGVVPADMPIPFAHTPSFAGSHLNGYDVMMKGILEDLAGREGREDRRHAQRHPRLRRLLGQPARDQAHAGLDGRRPPHARRLLRRRRRARHGRVRHVPGGGTTLAEAREAINAVGTIALQRFSSVEDRRVHHEGVGPGVRGRPVPDRHHRHRRASSPRSPR